MTASCEAFCWMTAQADGTEHAVTDAAQVAGIEHGKGLYEPLCGQRFLVACMDMGPLGRCSRCALFVRARGGLRDFEQRMTEYRQPGWLSRLLCRYQQPAGVGDPTEPQNTPTSAGLHLSTGVLRRGRGRHAA